MAREPTAAEALYGHLPQQKPFEAKRAQPNSLAAALYPSLSKEAKAFDKARARDRERLLRNLREARMKITGGR
jgi:hypothetical protein